MSLRAVTNIPEPLPNRTAVLLCGHGSRDTAALEEFQNLADGVRLLLPNYLVSCGFLSFGQPDFANALRHLAASGATRMLIAPLLLAGGNHWLQDIPRLLDAADAEGLLRGMTVRRAAPLTDHEGVMRAARARIEIAIAGAGVARAHTWLLNLGSGSEVASANETIATMGQRLTEQLGFGGGSTGFAAGSGANALAALAHAQAAGYRHVVVMPCFLFQGRLLARVLRLVEDAARAAAMDLVIAGHLGNHAGVIDAVLARIAEAESTAGVLR